MHTIPVAGGGNAGRLQAVSCVQGCCSARPYAEEPADRPSTYNVTS